MHCTHSASRNSMRLLAATLILLLLIRSFNSAYFLNMTVPPRHPAVYLPDRELPMTFLHSHVVIRQTLERTPFLRARALNQIGKTRLVKAG